MNPQQRLADLQSVLDELLTVLNDVVAFGEVLSDEFQGLLAQELGWLVDQIEQTSEQIKIESEEPQNIPPGALEEPISDNVNLLWILSGGQPNAFVSYLREFPEASFIRYLQDPNALAGLIQRLQQENPIERVMQSDGVDQSPLQSSNVWGFRFNPSTKKLRVRFNSGSVYEYDNVPDVIFNLFASGNAAAKTDGQNKWGRWWRGKNPSIGASLNQYIKAGGYNYRRIR